MSGGTTGRIRDPRRDAQILQTVEAAVNAGEIPKAVALARDALAGGLGHSLLFNLRAYWFEEQGRNDEALADLGNAVALAPDDPLIQNSYGLCLTKLDRWQEAIAAFQAAVRLKPDFPHAHFNLGWALERVGELELARQCFARANEIDPGSAEPIARLAALAARRADWDEADETANRALAIDPKQALAATAQINVRIARRDYDQALSLIERLLGDQATPPYERTVTLSLLGDLRHAQGRYSEALEAYSQSNQERRKIFAPRYEAPGTESAYSYVQWLIEYFETAAAEKWTAAGGISAAAGGGTATHAFLVGFPRSGTTLLENVLASNPAIVSLEEKEVLVDSVRAFLANERGRDRLETLGGEELEKYRRLYWTRVEQHGVNVAGKVFVDKQPLTSIKLPVIVKLFPGAKILFAIRDPRDVVLSCFRRQFMLNPSMYEFLTIEGAARFYAAVMHLSALYREKFGLAWHVVRHESVVDDFEAETGKVCDFLGVEWTEEMRQFTQRAKARPIATPSAVQVARGLNREGVGQWRNYAKELEPALPFLKPWIEQFGYPPD
ncbi:MAG: sulfotransferase [Rhizomicrobium sp.]